MIETQHITLFFGWFLFLLAAWQLDHFVSRFVWIEKDSLIEIFRCPKLFWKKNEYPDFVIYMSYSGFYMLCFIVLFIGLFILSLGVMLE